MNHFLLNDGFKKDNVAVLEKYVRDRNIDVCTFETENYPLLHWATDTRASNIMRWLLERGADKNGRGGEKNLTPLMLAALMDFQEGVDILLAAGADKTLRDTTGRAAVDLTQNASLRTQLSIPVTHWGCRHKRIPAGHCRAI